MLYRGAACRSRHVPALRNKGYVRRKNSLQWTMALLVTSIMLYLPANILPIMITDLLGDKMPSTIMAGSYCCGVRGLILSRWLFLSPASWYRP
jgi:uncharacterized paraquat-inducible protein A